MKIYKTLLLTGVFLSSFASIFSQEEIYEQGASCPIVTNRYSLQNSSTPITGYPTSGYHTANDIVVMFFWASWCGPCRIMEPEMREIADELNHKRINYVYINVDKYPTTAKEYSITSIPNTLIFRQGELINDIKGKYDKEKMKSTILYSLISIPTEPEIPDLDLTQQNNYIRTRSYRYTPTMPYIEKTEYFDGLGRLTEENLHSVTPSGKDIVALYEYDALNRASNIWLPGISSGNGAFIPIQQLKTSVIGSDIYGNDTYPYSTRIYENALSEQISEDYGPGIAWRQNGRCIHTEYRLNSTSDNCILYKITVKADETIVLRADKKYPENQLYVKKVTDEDGNVLYEFSNQLNQVIMTRQIDKSINHDTYYIYDNYGKLRIVLPPIASEKLSDINNYPETNPDINNYAYLYRYDARNRCIAKKIPGADWIYYIHDTADRIILSQNGEQRERGEWSFSIPDGLGRAVIEGICHNTIDYKQNPIKDIYVKATYNGNPQYAGYSISGFSPDAGYRITNVNYYDNYDFIPDLIPSPEKYGYDSVDGYDTRYTDYKDLLTGTATAILDERENTTYLYSVFYYDKKGRMIQSKSDNHLGGTEKEYTAYNFIDQPVTRKNIHVLNGNTITEEYGYFYDHADRLIKTTHKLNDNPVITISENTYDETGRLSTNTRGNNALLKSSYSYNIRSWITQISGNLFSQQLFYENPMPQGSAIYGGNISGISWTTNNITRNYRFSYDGLSRITKADYSGPGNFYSSYQYDKHGNITKLSRFGNTDSGNYGITDLVSFYYNGNQLKKADDAAIQIFNNLSADFKNYADADVEYSYNKNGALTKDLNKGITDIQYNLLNLPSEINISTPFTVGCTKYLYAANGMKLRVSHNNDPGLLNIPLMGTDQYYRSNLSDGSVTDFVGNLVYEDNTLKRILIDGGYIENGTYYFFLTDHLGSIRVVADVSGSVVQRNHFYPFGLSFADNENPETQPYKFNGKELDLFHGLNWYDYLARGMDPAAGRFTAIDPLCEKYFALSPYVFCANNPVNYIDPDGMDWFRTKDNSVQYDPNIKKNSKLEDGYTYLGETYQITDNNGNILENYRADGSIVYKKEKSAYERMILQSQRTGNESMAILTDKNVIVMPDYKNDSHEINLSDYGYSINNGNIIDANRNKYNTIATVHTHPDGSPPSTHDIYSYGDLGFAAYSTPYKPVYVLQMGKNQISFVVSTPNNKTKNDFVWGSLFLTNEYPRANIRNLLKGSFSLIQYTKSNNFIKSLNSK
ncbi:DUF6443 domain-containing protein [Coprobacter fastidiosus]|uniref:DUF6443 domain-containing protein n=1 Tax=Coprobacter fastidiosus TaxID=1099853 RepID=UPI0018A114E1|nr:thioredoxin domain-containing protein [Coprobacter fastidiosus]